MLMKTGNEFRNLAPYILSFMAESQEQYSREEQLTFVREHIKMLKISSEEVKQHIFIQSKYHIVSEKYLTGERHKSLTSALPEQLNWCRQCDNIEYFCFGGQLFTWRRLIQEKGSKNHRVSKIQYFCRKI